MTDRSERTEELGCGLKIYVSQAHVFTSDALLLAAFSSPKRKDKVCDMGAGCGIIPLIWYRDFTPAENIGIEISDNAAALFNKSIELNRLKGKIRCVNADIRDLKNILPVGYFDVVSMNPPYKKFGAGIVNEEEDYKNARHEYTCTLDDAASAASRLLRFGGRFVMCHRPERLCDIFYAMRENGVEPKILREVIQRRGYEPSLILIEGKKGAAPGIRIRSALYIEDDDGKYTDEASRIFNAHKKV